MQIANSSDVSAVRAFIESKATDDQKTSPFDVVEYATESGEVSTYRGVKVIGHDGYIQLVQQALNLVREGRIKFDRSFVPDLTVWAKGLVELEASWNATIAGTTAAQKTSIVYIPRRGYMVREDRPDMTVLRNCLVTGETEVIKPSGKADTRRDLTKVKEAIRDQTPLKGFKGNFNLEPGKFLALATSK